MIRSFRLVTLAVPFVGAAAFALTGCGSSTGPTPVPCTQGTVFTSRTPIPANSKTVQVFTTQAAGSLHVSLDWVAPTHVVSTVLAQAPCSVEQLENSACNVLFSLFSPPKPLEDATTLLPAGSYSLIIGNPNAVEESVSADVVLKSAGCPGGGQALALDPPAPTAAGRLERPYSG
jgi:hypothetical protein